MIKTAEQILKNLSRRDVPKEDLELILSLHKKTNGNAAEASRILGQEPHFSREQNYSNVSIIKYWRLAGYEIRKKGGNQNSGKSWKCRG